MNVTKGNFNNSQLSGDEYKNMVQIQGLLNHQHLFSHSTQGNSKADSQGSSSVKQEYRALQLTNFAEIKDFLEQPPSKKYKDIIKKVRAKSKQQSIKPIKTTSDCKQRLTELKMTPNKDSNL